MSKHVRSAALLAGEMEYMETLAERLSVRHDWTITIAEVMCEEVRSADLIVAESFWISELKEENGLLDKTVFLMEDEIIAESGDETVFPRMAYKYDGFRVLEQKICSAMDALRGTEEPFREKSAPVIVIGAWEGGESHSRRIARELARKTDATVLYLGLERFPEESGDSGGNDWERDKEKRDERGRGEIRGESSGKSRAENRAGFCPMENLLYYALDRMEMGGCRREDSVRAALSLSGGVCFLPECLHINPLWSLGEEQWGRLLPVLCRASRAQAVLLWTGREELTRCGGLCGMVGQCVYLRPENEDAKWNRFYRWLKEEGGKLVGTEVCLADSWTELLRMVVDFHADVA